MRKLRSHKEQLIERLKDPEYASAYLKACLDESFETNDIGVFQLAVRNVVEAHGGMTEISSKIEVNRESFYKSLSAKGNAKFLTLANTIKACGLVMDFHPLHVHQAC
jgi:probable addiction module antidote protein